MLQMYVSNKNKLQINKSKKNEIFSKISKQK